MTHVVYCWELGLGFGHVTRMNNVINDESLQGCTFSLILKEVHKAGAIDRCDLARVFQAPTSNSLVREASPNFSHLMSRCGWTDYSSALSLVSAWRNLFKLIQPDIVLLDHSPSAGMAALSLNLPVKQIGNGFEIPPVADPMPSMLFHNGAGNNQLTTLDKNLQHVLDKIEDKFLGKTTNRLTLKNLFRPENMLIAGSPILDHYGNRSAPWRYLQQVTRLPMPLQDLGFLQTNDRPAVFFYLDARTPRLHELLGQLSHQYQLFGYLSYLSDPNLQNSLAQLDIQIFLKPLNIEQALSVANVVLCNSGVGMLNNLLNKGIPSILAPLHTEQAMVAFQMHRRGLAFAIDRSTPLVHVIEKVAEYVKYPDIIRDKIKKSVMDINKRSEFWSGDLLKDFILS